MTAKKKVPGKRGRKPAPPGAKLSQLTIRLPPTQRLGLAILARDLGLSMSQALEYALSKELREHQVDGQSIEEFVLHWGKRPGGASPEAYAEEANQLDPVFLFLLPESMLTPEEKFFIEVFGGMAEAGRKYPVNDDFADWILRESRAAFRRGSSVKDAVGYLLDVIPEASK